MATATPALCTGVVKRGATPRRRRERDACPNTGVDGATHKAPRCQRRETV